MELSVEVSSAGVPIYPMVKAVTSSLQINPNLVSLRLDMNLSTVNLKYLVSGLFHCEHLHTLALVNICSGKSRNIQEVRSISDSDGENYN